MGCFNCSTPKNLVTLEVLAILEQAETGSISLCDSCLAQSNYWFHRHNRQKILVLNFEPSECEWWHVHDAACPRCALAEAQNLSQENINIALQALEGLPENNFDDALAIWIEKPFINELSPDERRILYIMMVCEFCDLEFADALTETALGMYETDLQ